MHLFWGTTEQRYDDTNSRFLFIPPAFAREATKHETMHVQNARYKTGTGTAAAAVPAGNFWYGTHEHRLGVPFTYIYNGTGTAGTAVYSSSAVNMYSSTYVPTTENRHRIMYIR